MTHRHFCTYFDHRYLVQGLALYNSLRANCEEFTLWVLALDVEAEIGLDRIDLPHLRVVSLAALEEFDTDLRACRSTRTLVEYYFTCSPCLPRYLLQHEPGMPGITYLDSDLFFFTSPEPLFAELVGSSVGIVPHRFSPRAARSHARFGHYNVGWLTFFRNAEGVACLEWWRERCIEWCYDRPEPDRYADQKYLEGFESRFAGVHVIRNSGANLAPWNVANHAITLHGEIPCADGSPLVFFHFQGLRALAGGFYDSNLASYGAHLTPVLRSHVFRPYLHALRSAQTAARAADAIIRDSSRIRRNAKGLKGLRYALGRAARAAKAAITRNVVRL